MGSRKDNDDSEMKNDQMSGIEKSGIGFSSVPNRPPPSRFVNFIPKLDASMTSGKKIEFIQEAMAKMKIRHAYCMRQKKKYEILAKKEERERKRAAEMSGTTSKSPKKS